MRTATMRFSLDLPPFVKPARGPSMGLGHRCERPPLEQRPSETMSLPLHLQSLVLPRKRRPRTARRKRKSFLGTLAARASVHRSWLLYGLRLKAAYAATVSSIKIFRKACRLRSEKEIKRDGRQLARSPPRDKKTPLPSTVKPVRAPPVSEQTPDVDCPAHADTAISDSLHTTASTNEKPASALPKSKLPRKVSGLRRPNMSRLRSPVKRSIVVM